MGAGCRVLYHEKTPERISLINRLGKFTHGSIWIQGAQHTRRHNMYSQCLPVIIRQRIQVCVGSHIRVSWTAVRYFDEIVFPLSQCQWVYAFYTNGCFCQVCGVMRHIGKHVICEVPESINFSIRNFEVCSDSSLTGIRICSGFL